MAKKSLYLFLTSILGVLLFLILDRLGVFVYLYLVGSGSVVASFDYVQFVFIDYFILTIVLMLGAWYGIWLGLGWYKQIYEDRTHGGFVDHLAKNFWPQDKPKNLESKISAVKQRLETDLWQLEDLSTARITAAAEPEAKVRRVVRKRAPKKIKA